MKHNDIVFLVYGAIWVSVAAAIIVAMEITRDMGCLWFFLIPAFINISSSSSNEKENGNETN